MNYDTLPRDDLTLTVMDGFAYETTFIHFERCQMTSLQFTQISYIIYTDHIDTHIYLGMLFPNLFQSFFLGYLFSWITGTDHESGQKSPCRASSTTVNACHSKTSGGAAQIT